MEFSGPVPSLGRRTVQFSLAPLTLPRAVRVRRAQSVRERVRHALGAPLPRLGPAAPAMVSGAAPGSGRQPGIGWRRTDQRSGAGGSGATEQNTADGRQRRAGRQGCQRQRHGQRRQRGEGRGGEERQRVR